MRLSILINLVLFTVFIACRNDDDSDAIYKPRYKLDNMSYSDTYEFGQAKGTIDNNDIDEASGIAICAQNSTFVWTHNDSGDENRIFLINTKAEHQITFRLLGATNRNWEDIAVGPGPEVGISYIYVADIGDNAARYSTKKIYRIPEPDLSAYALPIKDETIAIEGVETIEFELPEGRKMDCESLLLDPLTKDLFVITKREEPVRVYRLPFPQSTNSLITAELYATLPMTWAVGGDISADGMHMMVKTRTNVYYWRRSAAENIGETLLNKPDRLKYIEEPQGEALAILADGSAYYTLSEENKNIKPVLYYYPKK